MSRQSSTFRLWRERHRATLARLVADAERRAAAYAWVRAVSPPPTPGHLPGEKLYRVPCPHGNGGWATACVTFNEWGRPAHIDVGCPFCMFRAGALDAYLRRLGSI